MEVMTKKKDGMDNEITPESPQAQPTDLVPPTDVALEEVDPCGGHLVVSLFEEESVTSFGNPGEKFADVNCMNCGKGTKPSIKTPIHYCPYFETHCEAVLCHGCYNNILCKEDVNVRSTRRSQKTIPKKITQNGTNEN